ncbi:MAG: ribose-phosphate pyrophosphokinase [Ignavibacteriae bacterium]|nr:ribose-phosphate pyrophosphokinase [Ignavibacteriota bacterium]
MPNLKIFSGRNSTGLAKDITKKLNLELGDCDIKTFSDGEIWIKYNENIRGCDVFVVQSTDSPADNLLELLIMLDAAKRSSAARVNAVIPYFGYARQDRKDQPRVSITAKLIANLIEKAGADRVITMDLHAAQIQGFFDIPVDHLYGSAVFLKHFFDMNIPNLAVASPDVGGIKMARAYAKRLHADLIVIDKRRPKPNVAEVMNIIGEVNGKNVIIIDDLIDTAGTFVNAVNALKEKGALEVYGACTHPILSGEAINRINDLPVKKLFVTDTIPLHKESDKIEVKSVASLFAEAIKRTNENESISSLFEVI